jgi:hypothetical protein
MVDSALVETKGIEDADLKLKFERARVKIFSDIQSAGFRSLSTRMGEAGQYAHTLGVVEHATSGEIRIHLLEHGNYKKGEPDRPYWYWHNIVYHLDEGNQFGLLNLALQIEEDANSRVIQLKAFDKNMEEVKLDPQTKRTCLNFFLDGVLEATPDVEKTEVMRQSVASYGPETSYIRDLQPQLQEA